MTNHCYSAVVMVTATTILANLGIRATRVTTINGVIEGYSEIIDGVPVDIYLGIPFANPPLGDNRFRAPQPVKNWTEVKQTNQPPNCCMQTSDNMFGRFKGVEMWNPNTNISEDCLYLNIWAPRTENASKPTLIWIYGGSYVYGSITLDVYDGRFLAAKASVIVASMQYRMGVHGFLYTGTEDAPGNMGLLDQQLAIKWIHDNIQVFGGDLTKITLIGESAGAASVSYHLLAQTSWPYFTNAIMLSSTALSPWAIDEPKSVLNDTQTLAKLMKCNVTSTHEIIKCLRQASASELQDKQWFKHRDVGTFIPTVDGSFLTDTPNTLLRSGNMKRTDILLGVTKDEGQYFLLYWYPDVFPPEKIWNRMHLNRTQFEQTIYKIASCEDNFQKEAVLYLYELSGLPSIRGDFVDMLDDALGDKLFKCPLREFASYYADVPNLRTYVYSFDYRHSANPWPSWMGAMHGYEIELVFGLPFNLQLNYSETDRKVSRLVMDLFAEFAHKGNLSSYSSRWPEFTTASEDHLVFTQEGDILVKNGLRNSECSFLKNLLPKLQQQTTIGPCNMQWNGTATFENLSASDAIFYSRVSFSVALVYVGALVMFG